MNRTTITAAATFAAALALVLSGCGSDTKTEPSTSTSAKTSASATTSASESTESESTEAAPGAAGQTIAEYINENGIQQTVEKPAENGAPNVDLPTPEGWETTSENLPDGSYGGVRYTGADADPGFPPTIYAYLSKLEGDVDPATLLEVAPNELMGLPDYQGPDAGTPENLSGFDATEIAGTATMEGAPRFAAQKTVMIPGSDGTLYMLLLNAYSTPEQQDKLGAAMGLIDAQTVITP